MFVTAASATMIYGGLCWLVQAPSKWCIFPIGLGCLWGYGRRTLFLSCENPPVPFPPAPTPLWTRNQCGLKDCTSGNIPSYWWWRSSLIFLWICCILQSLMVFLLTAAGLVVHTSPWYLSTFRRISTANIFPTLPLEKYLLHSFC